MRRIRALHPLRTMFVVVLALPALVSCSRAAESRPVLERDTLVVFGHQPIAPAFALVYPDGRADTVRDPGFRLSSDTAVKPVRPGRFRCEVRGDAVATLSRGSHSIQQVIRCRPAARLAGPRFVNLFLGGQPEAFGLFAVDSSGHRERIRDYVPVMSDTTVVAVHDDAFHPLRVGQVRVEFRIAGAVIPTSVKVRELIAYDSLRLSPGEFRAWKLEAGRYEITMQRAKGPSDLKAIEMSTEGAKCVRDSQSDETIHCLVREHGGLAVRNISAATGAREQRAILWVVKTP